MRFGTLRQAKDKLVDWIAFHDNRRLHLTLRYAYLVACEQI